MKDAVASMPLGSWFLKKPDWFDHQTAVVQPAAKLTRRNAVICGRLMQAQEWISVVPMPAWRVTPIDVANVASVSRSITSTKAIAEAPAPLTR
jgi:hypothetical protein